MRMCMYVGIQNLVVVIRWPGILL